MKTTGTKKVLSVILCMVLLAAAVLMTAGCAGRKNTAPTDVSSAETVAVGEGNKQFMLTVTDAEGNTSAFAVRTEEETVGAALLRLDIIEGENGPYGLYIKTVNGIRADFDKDGVYWAFYENGEYAMAGADMTPITDGADYALRVEK